MISTEARAQSFEQPERKSNAKHGLLATVSGIGALVTMSTALEFMNHQATIQEKAYNSVYESSSVDVRSSFDNGVFQYDERTDTVSVDVERLREVESSGKKLPTTQELLAQSEEVQTQINQNIIFLKGTDHISIGPIETPFVQDDLRKVVYTEAGATVLVVAGTVASMAFEPSEKSSGKEH